MKSKVMAWIALSLFVLTPAWALAQPAPAPMEAAMEAPKATPVPANKADSVATTVLKWVAIGGGVLVGILLSVFGVKKLLRHMNIVEAIKKGAESWAEHAKSTKYTSDDVAAKILVDVSSRLLEKGKAELKAEEEAKVLKLAAKEQEKVPAPEEKEEVKEDAPKTEE